MNHFTNRQALVLCVLSMVFGALFSPLSPSHAQPSPAGADNEPQLSETPEPLATPPASSSSISTRGVSPQAVGAITGQGTTGYISKFTGTNAVGNSVLFESNGKVGIGTTTPTGLLSVKGTATNVYSIYGLGVGNTILGSSSGGIGVYGQHTATTGDQAGVSGESSSTSANAAGVLGTILATSPGVSSAGLRGINKSTSANGYGIWGSHAGLGSGVYGTSPNGNGVLGDSVSAAGVRGRHTLGNGTAPGVSGETNSTSASAVGVQGIINATSAGASSAGIRGINNSTSGNGYGVYGSQAGSGVGVYGTTPDGNGVIGRSTTSTGVSGVSTSGFGAAGQSTYNYGLYGESSQSYGVYGTSSRSDGVYGTSSGAAGVHGISAGFSGVRGDSTGGEGVTGVSTSGHGVVGTGGIGVVGNANSSNPNADGVQGIAFSSNSNSAGVEGNDGNGGNGPAFAGYFYGRVTVKGNLTVMGTLAKSAGSFKIDNPLHPATQYLSHSFVESPDMMNVYNGNTKTNSKGEAWVRLPNYFSALNRDFRYQLTPMGQFAQVIVGQKIAGNRFLIRTDKPNVEVSWQVTGIRHDAYARQNRIKVEETKTGADRGKYLYPAGFGFGSDKQIGAPPTRLAKR